MGVLRSSLLLFVVLFWEYVNSQTTEEPLAGIDTGPMVGQKLEGPNAVDGEHMHFGMTTDHGFGVNIIENEITYNSEGYRLEGHVLLTVRAFLPTQCSRRCDLHPACQSCNFYQKDERCELNAKLDTDVPVTSHPGATYLHRGTYVVPEVALGSCHNNPCMNGGWCLNVTTTAGINKALCVCKEGWGGDTCSQAEGSFGWGEWEEWSQCSATCGDAVRTRERLCVNTVTQQAVDAVNCFGAEVDIESCTIPQCPAWKAWSEWSECSTGQRCGVGEKTRTRECSNGGTPDVDRLCKGPTKETTPCSEPSCHGPLKLTSYGEGEVLMVTGEEEQRICADDWSQEDADVVCRQLGFYRGAAEAYDVEGGSDYGLSSFECTGDERTLQSCKHSRWSGFTCVSNMAAAVKCIVDGAWGKWTEWGECSTTCTVGFRERTRQCNHPPAANGGEECAGEDRDTKDCNLGNCPVDGSRWKHWSQWSACSEVCDGGERTRTRTCESGACSGPDQETERCNLISCKVAAKWTFWAYWSPCDVSCDGGLRSRSRSCLSKDDEISCTGHDSEVEVCAALPCKGSDWRMWEAWSTCSFSCGGGEKNRRRSPKSCDDVTTCIELAESQSVSCQPDPCPEDCYHKAWSEWSVCTVTCGGGTMVRTRTKVAAQHNGAKCKGPSEEEDVCMTHECPIDCVWQEWSAWSDCSEICGGGLKSRGRTGTGPFYGGANCTGEWAEDTSCNTNSCEEPVWGQWGSWSDCSVSCGSGTQGRSRECIESIHGNDVCEGESQDKIECSTPCPSDCVWMEWSEWTECTATCGGGTMDRHREFQEATHGGLNCTGPSAESDSCSTDPCPVDGYWSKWSDWTPCNETCGDGIRTRNRTCTPPKFNGKDCVGDSEEEEACKDKECPVDGVWGMWSDWTQCSEVCGGGTQHRARSCEGPYRGGKDCPGDTAETQACNTEDCPKDGYWEFWGAWGECSLSCGTGMQVRTRVCVPPKFGGTDCVGEAENEQTCNTHNCPVDGFWEAWSDWGACNVSCGGGSQRRSRTCTEPLHGGGNCEGDLIEDQGCNSHPCPIDGYWLEWGDWEVCSVTCGGGNQSRQRACQPPQHGGLDCHGNSEESQACNSQPCPVDGFWREWGEWQACDVTCGGGRQFRSRHCEAPLHGGKECEGETQEGRDCNTHHCPVDCVWQEWSQWEHCNVTCGWGQQRRVRDKQDERYGGQPCEGSTDDWQDCFPRHCPVDGVWHPWSDWTACTVTCGGGSRMRNRTCDPPRYDGKDCAGASMETETCSTDPCPIPGDWTAWSSWSPCTISCAGGTRTRMRECDMESYAELTAPCIGNASDVGMCHEYPCQPLARTCQEWVSRGLVDTVDVDIEVDPFYQPFRIRCEVDLDQKLGTGIIGHDKEGRHHVQGFEGAGEYEADLTYHDVDGNPLPLEAVITYADISGYCSQYISWECNAAGIHHPFQPDIQTTYWTNRYNEERLYWGGVQPGSNMCACGVNGTCSDPTKLCNCDMNDNVWRRDDGYLAYKDDLPLHSFRAGDTGREGYESGVFSVGPLTCAEYDQTLINS